MLRQSHSAVIERNIWWEGEWVTEPYETAWAIEAIAYVRVLERRYVDRPVSLSAQISPDGIHWCDEGSMLTIAPDQDLAFVRLTHFGGWLRFSGMLETGEGLKVVVYFSLKG